MKNEPLRNEQESFESTVLLKQSVASFFSYYKKKALLSG